MRVGIYTHYAHCDQTYFCVRLVDFLRENGVEFSIYSENEPGKLRIPYDSAVTHKGLTRYTDWAKKQTAVIWTHVPKIEQINFANRHNKLTVLVPMWQEMMPPIKKAMQRADTVVAMSAECRELFSDVYSVRATSYIPFDTGLPVTKKDALVNSRCVKIFLPWFDRNARCAHSSFLSDLAYLFEHMPDAELTVAIMSSRFSPAIAKFFQALGQRTNGRVKLVRNVPFAKRASLYGEHDLTLFPAECDNYGFCGLTSISCGTPVLSFAVSPQLDYVYPNENGVLVRTKTDYDENGVPHAVPDYSPMTETLQTLIAEPWHIDNMNKRVNYNLATRRKSFDSGWKKILGIA